MSGFRGWGWRGPGPPIGIPFGLNDQSPQAQGLMAWWPALGSQGNKLRDFALQCSDGTLAGGAAISACSEKGLALRGNGIGENVAIANNPIIQAGDYDFTFGLRFYLNTFSASQILLRKWIGYYLQAYVDSSKILWCTFGTTLGYLFSTQTISAGRWYTVLCWHDSVANQVGIRINTLTPTTGAKSDGIYATTTALFIGFTDASFDGYISEVCFWKRILPAAEQLQYNLNPWDLYRPLVRRVWHVPIAVGWPRISPQLATIAPQGPRVGGIYVN